MKNLAWENFPPMLDAANNTSTAQYMSVVPDFLNVNDFFKYQAANVYLLNFDNYIGFRGNQLYYFDENTEVWEVIPWDFNASFGLWNTNNFRPFNYDLLPPNITGGCIASNINDVPELRDVYMGTMCNLVNNLADTTRLIGLIDQWRNQIEEAVYQDMRKDFTNTRFDEATEYGYFPHASEEFVPAMKTFVIDRWEYINQQMNNAGVNCSEFTSTNNLTNKTEIAIYPNPTNGVLNFTITSQNFEHNIIKKLELYNSTGQLMQSQEQDSTFAGKVDISDLNSGFYYFKVIFYNEQYLIERIVKL